MRLAKIVKNQIVGIVESDVADDRRDEEGGLIYRPIQDDLTPVPDTHGVVGDEFIIQDNQVVRKPKIVKLTQAQMEARNLSRYHRDPELPSIEERLDTLESGDKDKIAANAAKVEELKKKHKV